MGSARAPRSRRCNRPPRLTIGSGFAAPTVDSDFLHRWFGTIARVLQPGRSFYLWGGYANCANYPPVLKATGLYFSQVIIWHKQHPVLTRAVSFERPE